jgi:type II secretory pathway predicted ATPase ExeA/cytochrome c-type biogenesis protein CcmH/NrfG
MYLSHYNLAEKPFRIDTDPRFLWFGEKHQEALAVLKYGVRDRNGFVVLTGGIGTGKTTILNALLQSLEDDVLVANINNPKLDTLDFLKIVAKSFEPTAELDSKADFIIGFNRFLHQAHADGRIVLLVVDEAHCLSPELLEEIRLLSNVEQAGKRLINIFLVGQDELKQSLQSLECRALRQRVTLFYDIKPLSEEEMVQYIGHRLKVAGSQMQLFTEAAIHEIHRFSLGYPRLINVVCDHALLTGYIQGLKTIPPEVVKECARDIHFHGETALIPDTPLTGYRLRRRQTPSRNPQGRSPFLGVISTATAALARLKNKLPEVIGRGKAGTGGESTLTTPTSSGSSSDEKRRMPVSHDDPRPGKNTDRHAFGVRRQTLFYGGLLVGIGIVAGALTLMVQATPAEKTNAAAPSNDTASAQAQESRLSATTSSQPFGVGDGRHASPTRETDRTGRKTVEVRELAAGGAADKNPAPTSRNGATATQAAADSVAAPAIKKQNTPRHSPLKLAQGALLQKNYRLALELLEATRETDRPPEFNIIYAQALVGQARLLLETSPRESETMLREATARDPENKAAHFILGRLYTRSKDYPRAIQAYTAAVDLDPDFADARFNLGFIYASTGIYADAEKMFAEVVRTAPPYLDKALFNLAMVQHKTGKHAESRVNLEKALAVNPDNRKAQLYLKRLKTGEGTNR